MSLILGFLLLISPLAVQAHSKAEPLEKVVDGYKIEINYNPAHLVSGKQTTFDFSLWNEAGLSEDFEYVWVRLEHKGEPLLATGVAPAPRGPTSLLFAIPRTVKDEMTLHARFEGVDKKMAEADFPLKIEQPEKDLPLRPLILLGVIVVTGAIGFLLGRHKRI